MASSLTRARRRIDRWLGSRVVFDLSRYDETLEAIAELVFEGETDAALRMRSEALRERARKDEPLDTLRVEAFALVREAAHRTIGLRPFDVQLLAGLGLHDGFVVEMQTGEGKTLAAVLPAYLNALTGRGVHVLTANDYLARRDADWMGPIYRLLGLSVDTVQDGMTPERRKRAYAADVTYLTAKEAGFDLLRDGLCHEPGDVVQRPYHFAVVDEADSLMIDEARVPLVIAGSVDARDENAYRMAEIALGLEPGVHYAPDDNRRTIDLTEAGLLRVETLLGIGDLLAESNLPVMSALYCALHARVLLERDVDYLLRDGKVMLVDELTGRVVEDRHWPDGLQAALEAKEGLELREQGEILGSITLQHLLRLYPRLAGMTGTAQSAADELQAFYGLDVMVVPPNRPCIREDFPDRVFATQQAKQDALVEEIRRVHETGRPVLVGTLSVAESDELADALLAVDVPCRVLNARTDEREATIVAAAGALGAVTISTNMAGRGTDIRLGERVADLGGLYVIGTNRHESVRIDRQLRGRAGRQGDPGSSRFFVSLCDPLARRFDDRDLSRAQRIVDGQNFEIRRTLADYAEGLEQQRTLLQERRRELLLADVEGASGIERARRQAQLFHIDRRFSEHLAAVADLREGIHLLRVAGRDPLAEFMRRSAELFGEMRERIDADVEFTLARATIGEDGLDLEREGLRGPSSTWTYMVNDDPFRDELGVQLVGNTGVAAGVALYALPFLVLWGLARRLRRSRA